MELGNELDQENLLVTGADDEDVVLTKSNDLFSYVVEPKAKKGKGKAKKEKSQAESMDSPSNTEISNIAHHLSLLMIADTVYYTQNDDSLDLSKYNYLSDEETMYHDRFYNTLAIEDDQQQQSSNICNV